MKNTPTIKIMSFVKFIYPEQQVKAVSTRDVSDLELPDECEFYFFDSYVGIIDGITYPFGPEQNVSPRYYKAEEHYPEADKFRVYFMRCYGWKEADIWNPENLEFNPFSCYNSTEFPKGVVIVNRHITNPGKNGIILSAKKTVTDYEYPSREVLEAYKNCMD